MSEATEWSRRTSGPAEVEAAASDVFARRTQFARLSIAEKRALLRACQTRLVDVAEAWVRDGMAAKGLPHPGEEWLAGPVPTMRNLRLLEASLGRLARGTLTRPLSMRRTSDGRVAARVFPASTLDRLLFAGFRVEAHMADGLSEADVHERAGRFYRASSGGGPGQNEDGGLSLILGAGNVSSIPPMDALYKSFVEGQVAVIKMNPVNAWAGPHLEAAFAPMIEAGYWRVVYGGADVGQALVESDAVSDIHITGSNHTHDLLVWGPPGPERERRKRDGDPVLKKTITSELGNVSPVAVFPAVYRPAELRFLADNVAAMVANNASFNCNAAKLLVLADGWPQKNEFLECLRGALKAIPTRPAYYPGARDRFESLVAGRTTVERIGTETEACLPWTLILVVDPNDASEPVFSTEPFCSVLSVTELPAQSAIEFTERLVPFLNERVWGTLNAMLVVPPALARDREVTEAVDDAVLALRYGTVAINHWPALVFATTSPAWGGHPSSTLADVQSGIGWVHNTFMLEGIEKSVLWAPFMVKPRPVWFANHRHVEGLGKRLFALETNASFARLPGVVAAALRG